MAGIGFALRRMLEDPGFAGPVKAFGYATLLTSGPWIAASLALALLAATSALAPHSNENHAFLALVSYAYAFSLIGYGAIQMVASRYLADRIYEGRPEAVAPAYTRLLFPLLLGQLVVGSCFLAFVPLPVLARLAALLLYLALNGIWLAMGFVSVAGQPRGPALALGFGLVVSLVAGHVGGTLGGLSGQLLGYASGHVLSFLLLQRQVDRCFGPASFAPSGIARAFRQYAALAWTGLAYNLGCWIDKILFWGHAGTGESVAGWLRSAPTYDNAMFLAYLTIIPALALFLIKVETDFYDRYRAYFRAIASHANLAELLRLKEQIRAGLRSHLVLLLKVQAPLTLGLMLFAPELLRALDVSWLSVFVFRTGVFGALLHGMHLVVLVLLLYFDLRLQAAALATLFCVSNALFTLGAFQGGLGAHGYGYTLACGLTLWVGLALLQRALDRLEYHVFMGPARCQA